MVGCNAFSLFLAYGRSSGIKYRAAEAAGNYSTKGLASGWYLPAAGQLWLMHEHYSSINNTLKKIIGKAITESWASPEVDSSSAWLVNMGYGGITFGKSNPYKVRAVASVVGGSVPAI